LALPSADCSVETRRAPAVRSVGLAGRDARRRAKRPDGVFAEFRSGSDDVGESEDAGATIELADE